MVDDQGYCNAYHEDVIRASTAAYYHLLKKGVAPEQARMVLPQSMMTNGSGLALWQHLPVSVRYVSLKMRSQSRA